jgi:hypothetical protein
VFYLKNYLSWLQHNVFGSVRKLIHQELVTNQIFSDLRKSLLHKDSREWIRSLERENYSEENGYIHWNDTTTQPITRLVKAFEFSTIIVSTEQLELYDCVKLVTGSKSLIYELSNGDILYDVKTTASFHQGFLAWFSRQLCKGL